MNIKDLLKDNRNNKALAPSTRANFAFDAAVKGQQDQLFGTKPLDFYADKGITPIAGENLDEYLPETQSALTKIGNSLAQILISEIGLGVPKAFSDLVDIVGNVFRGNEDYTNPVSQFFEQKQEEFRNFAPIYYDQSLNIDNGGMKDIGWWASNAPSIVSSLTLMLPGAAVTKGVSALAKLANVGARSKSMVSAITGAAKRIERGEKLSKFQAFANSDKTAKATNMLLNNISTAAISRTVENYQEGRQVYNDMYLQASEEFKDDNKFNEFVKRNEEKLDNANINKNSKDEVAKFVANNSADETFKLDYLNTAFDVLQLYTAKNAFKTLRNAPDTGRKIKIFNKQIAKEIGKTPEQIAELNKGISKLAKAKEWTLNNVFGSAKLIGAELSEGIEEAVNYIAQQEGMTFGNTLLTGEGTYSNFWNRIANGFDGRLESYINSPELHESAFWGVMGGVVFQAGSNGLNRVYNTFVQKAADKESEDVKKEKKPWYWLEQLPETKRRIEEIRQRNVLYNNYINNLKLIDKGVDVFQPTSQQVEGELDTEELKTAAKNRAYNDYVTDLTMNAVNNGNYDLLRAYLEDDNVRQGMIESGLFDTEGKTSAEIETESKDFIDKTIRKMDEVANEYDKELVALNNITVSKQFKGRVPQEYLAIIAVDNIKRRHAIKEQDDILSRIDAKIAEKEAELGENPTTTERIKRALALNTMAYQLGYLRQERKSIAEEPDSIGNRIALSNIDRQIESIEKDIKDEEIAYVTSKSLQMMFDENHKMFSSQTSEFDEYYGKIVTGEANENSSGKTKFEIIDDKILKLPARSLTRLDDTGRQQYGLLDQASRDAKAIVEQKDKELYDAYNDKAYAQLKKKHLESMISRDTDTVAKRVGELTNTFNLARNKAIENKGKIMTELYIKHGQIIRDIVKAELFGDTKSLKNLYSKLDPKTITTIKDVFKIYDFTKSYNQDIAAELEDAFNKVDRIERAEQEKAKQNGEVENVTNQQGDIGQQSPQPTNPPQTDLNDNTDQQNGQQEQSQQPNNQSQPQQSAPQNPTPSSQPTTQQPTTQQPSSIPTQPDVNQPTGPIETVIRIPVTLNSGQQDYINRKAIISPTSDGNFEVINPNKELMTLKFIYDRSNTDLTRPYEVDETPIVEYKDGKYTVIKQGTLINTDTLEYKQRQQAGQQGGNLSTGDVAAQTSGQSSQSYAQQSQNPVTQREDIAPSAPQASPTDDSFNPSIEDEFMSKENQEKDARQQLREIVIPIIFKDKTKDPDEQFDIAVDLLVKNGLDRELLESQRKVIVSLCKHIIKPKNNKLDSTTDELIIESMFNPFENNDRTGTLRIDFTTKVESMIDAYCDEFGIQRINNKKYINFEDLLRFLNSRSEDKLTSDIIYYGLNEYLKTDRAKEKYIRTDELGDDLEEAEANINKTVEERTLEQINASSQRINLDSSVIQNFQEKDEKDLYEEMAEAFDDANIGDDIVYEFIEDKLIFKDNKGRILGSNTLPQIDPNTGVRTLRVSNFIYDLNKDKNGILKSKIKDLIYKWFTDDSVEIKDIQAILYSVAYESHNSKELKDLAERFANNPAVRKAIADGFLTDITTDYLDALQAIKHLSKLFKFRNNDNTLNARHLKNSLDTWFNKVYDNYESAIYLSQHPNTPIKISKISDGISIRNADNPKDSDYLPASNAIAGGPNLSTNKVCITDKNKVMKVSGQTSVPSRFDGGRTYVTIPNRNGSIEYIKCRPARFSDAFISYTAKEIIESLRSHLKQLFTDYYNNKNADTFNTLKDFILNTFNKDNSCLFYGAVAFMDRSNRTNDVIVLNCPINNCKLRINIAENTIDVFRPEYPTITIDKGSYNKKKLVFTDKAIFETLDDIINSLRFQINEKLVNSDNRSEDANINGILSKRSNKFTIKIGDNVWEYNSFNEFMLSNDLVALNTHPNDTGTSNFVRDSMTKLDYTITDFPTQTSATTSPVEDSSSTQPVVVPTNISKTDRLLAILNDTIPSDNKGVDIFTLFLEKDGILTEDDITALKSLKDLGLLPKTIIFDESFNQSIVKPDGKVSYNGPNAQSNTETGVVTLGNKWMNYWNTNRSYAMRLLIHEQLHLKIHSNKKNEKYYKNLKDVFAEFENAITEDNVRKYLERLISLNLIKGPVTDKLIASTLDRLQQFRYLQYGEDTDRRLEEFLVDSLMNRDLIEFLNSVDVKDIGKENKHKNLFQKILELLSEIFGWGIVKNSLREKELNNIRYVLNENKTSKPKTKNKSKAKKIGQPMLPGLFDEVQIEQPEQIDTSDNDKTESPIIEESENEDISENEEQVSQPEEYIIPEKPNIDDFRPLSDDELGLNDDIDLDIDAASDDFSDNNFMSTTNETTIDDSYTDEMRSIKEQSIADGTYMKAPNGSPTNLNERQWLQVRTKNFINWFGDWINNPAEASKVVDKNGEPLVVYHGSPIENFNIFKKHEINEGFYFTTDINYSNSYGSSRAFFLNIRNIKNLQVEYRKVERKHWDGRIVKIRVPFIGDKEISIYEEAEKEINHKNINRDAEYYKSNGIDGVVGYDSVKTIYKNGKLVDEIYSEGTEYVVFNPNQIKSATSNNGEFSTTNDDIRYSTTDELSISQVKEDCQNFLDNFGIDINSYPISDITDRFDKVNRLINANTEEEITDGVGEAVAFMMQYSKQFNELLTLKNINTPLQYKGIRRASKNNSEIHIESKFTEEQRKQAIKEIGADIAKELRRRYNIKEKYSANTTSIMQKIKELINKFFELFTPTIRNQFRVINNNIRNIVDNIILNDPTVINPNNIKPGTFGKETTIINYEKALKENPYEENIISILNSYDIALAGSASMAVFGVVYRPSENPMHDIDFNAQGKTPTAIENILKKEFKNVYNTNSIIQGEGHTETYLILDRPFKVEHTKDDGTFILDATTGEYLGKYIYSNLKLVDGVKGKMLDFFLGNTSPYGSKTATLNGKKYKFTDPRNAILAKITWSRCKDIFDYNRFISKEQKEKLDRKRKENTKEIVDRIKKSNIIWASPTIGKTTYIKDHKNEIIEWDEQINPKRNAFIKEQIDPNDTMTKEDYNNARSEYMSNLDSHPEYVDFLTKEWNDLKLKARRENKKIFASPLPLLKLFADDFDLIINSNENVFFKRNTLRGGKNYSTRYWKQDINNVLTNINKDKVVTTDLYFSDLMNDVNENSNIHYSSTEELTVTTASSFLDAQSQLPIELRSNFASLIDSATIRSQCK